MRALLSLLCLALLGACTTNPVTGRGQIVAMPSVQLAYADMDFALASSAQRFTAAMQCAQDCEGVASSEETTARIAALGVRLEAAARNISPELFERIERFSIEIDANPEIRTGSNASGRIVLSAGLVGQGAIETGSRAAGRRDLVPGLGGLDSTEIRLAFLVAREMGHVIARHAEENSGASLAASALGLLVPGLSVIARFVASRVGAGAVQDSWASDQQSEADGIALALLAQAGLSPFFISLALEGGAIPPEGSGDAWSESYLKSMRHVSQLAVAPLSSSGCFEPSHDAVRGLLRVASQADNPASRGCLPTVVPSGSASSFSGIAEDHYAVFLSNGGGGRQDGLRQAAGSAPGVVGGGEGDALQCEPGDLLGNGYVALRPI